MKSLAFLTCETGECKNKSYTSAALLLLRVVLGVIFVIHGWQKLFGDIGVDGFAQFLTSLSFPAPLFFAWVVSLLEFFGGIAVILGVFTRPISLLLAINMAFAFFLTKGALPAGDVDVALFAISLALALAGAGRFVVWRSRCCRGSQSKTSRE